MVKYVIFYIECYDSILLPFPPPKKPLESIMLVSKNSILSIVN